MASTSDHTHTINGQKESTQPPKADGLAVVMVPLPAQGHLNQLLHLSRLISSYGVPVHYVAAATHVHQAKLRLHGWDPSSDTIKSLLHFHGFEIRPFPSPPPDPNSTSKFPSHLIPAFEAATSHLRQHVAALVRSLASVSRRIVVVHDSLMASAVQDTVSVSNAESYIFESISAFSIYWFSVSKEAVEQGQLPGVFPEVPPSLEGVCLDGRPSLEGCLSEEFWKFVEQQYMFWNHSSGSLYNTSRVVEGVYMELLEKAKVNQEHWAIGPVNPVRISPLLAPKHKCIEWLDCHPHNSVIYVSFGTTVALTKDQIYEIAIGLENSGQRFLWVLKEADKGDNFNNTRDGDNVCGGEDYEDRARLPEGFEERVKGVGLVVREWAPQLEILGHPSVGGFMSHCGWNSCMESISMGVPIVAWPWHSDQPSNSVLVTTILKVGIMVKEWLALKNGCLVESSYINRAVKLLMSSEEGEGMRKRAATLGEVIRTSVTDDGGVSRAELDSFIAHITR